MTTKISGWMANIGLFLFSMTIVFVVGEIAVRFLKPMHVGARALMFSSETFRLDKKGAVRYQPDRNIRTVAVYDNKIEYDVHFETNNLGFIDDKDYEYENSANKRYYAFVGDSFTAGVHGGDPWVPRLRRDVEGKDIEIFNLGVTGTGIEHFYKLLQSTSEQLNITHIVILAISDDLRRDFWYPIANSSEIRFCQENVQPSECTKMRYIAKIIHPALSTEDILKVADRMTEDGARNLRGDRIRSILKRSELLVFIVRSLKAILQKEQNYSLHVLRNIREAFPSTEMHFLHLPEKQEVVNGTYFFDNIEKDIEEMGISYFPLLKECRWKKNMFFTHDNHPNNVGYDNIRDCVSSYILSLTSVMLENDIRGDPKAPSTRVM